MQSTSLATARENLPYIRTHMGVRFHHLDPWPEDIYIEDIAHALSMLCRFTGHVDRFYSVGEHSVRVSYIVPQHLALWGLLHDGSEAYCNDLNRPLKYAPGLEGYKGIEQIVQQTICKRFGLTMVEPPAVKEADQILLATEGRDLFATKDDSLFCFKKESWGNKTPLIEVIEPWTQEEAKNRFLMRFYELTGENRFYGKSNSTA